MQASVQRYGLVQPLQRIRQHPWGWLALHRLLLHVLPAMSLLAIPHANAQTFDFAKGLDKDQHAPATAEQVLSAYQAKTALRPSTRRCLPSTKPNEIVVCAPIDNTQAYRLPQEDSGFSNSPAASQSPGLPAGSRAAMLRPEHCDSRVYVAAGCTGGVNLIGLGSALAKLFE
jgi:hypothetical protein